ncbi:MAG: acylneuraminate cytidylyltransferase family protein [Bacteroidales bacterium]|nr:acylneuraminate cytidylyltransferase family protein [Bacteroidales bacterium]
MKIVALIPIKMGSKRVPQKNIKPFFDGTPLMSFIQQTCLDSDLIDEVFIYCSDESVKPYILPRVKFLKRPIELDADDKNANDIIRTFMKEIDADVYVNAHTTSPFAKVTTINKCIEKVVFGKYDSAFCAENIKAFLWMNDKPINFDPDHFPRTQDLPDVFAETSIAYVFTKESFLKYNRRVGVKPFICEVGKVEAMDIDYPEDFAICDAIYKMRKEA